MRSSLEEALDSRAPHLISGRAFSAAFNSQGSRGYLRLVPHLSLLVLFFAEILYLTISFDTQTLDRVPAYWARLVGWTPQYLRVAITSLAVALLVSGQAVSGAIRDGADNHHRFRYLTAHLAVFLLFTRVTAILMGSAFPASQYQGLWALTWVSVGLATVVTWTLSVLPSRTWVAVLRRGRAGLVWGVGVGVTAWAGGFLSQEFWKPLSRYTFAVVTWLVQWVYSDTVSDPTALIIGTPTFSVDITPECSGYEGIALILAFLGIHMWLSRRQLRFPHALFLLPIGAAAIWLLNAVRIAGLIVIGTSGHPDIALGGFHSQAGWISFNAVALILVALSIRARYFMRTMPGGPVVIDAGDPTTAFLAPFLAIVATAMLTAVYSLGFDWLYPARVIVAVAVLWSFREHYAHLDWKWSWRAVAIGAVAFLVWIALLPRGAALDDRWPDALGDGPSAVTAIWLTFRVVGYVITVPLAEELAFRGFLMRRLVRTDFHQLPLTTFSWLPFLISSLLFGALHGRFWVAGTIAGMLFGLAMYRGKSLGDAVQAHATTNGLMALYVFSTGHWSAWS